MSQNTKTIALWIGRILLAVLFVAAGMQKLLGRQMMIDEFDHLGLGQWFRYLTGMIELLGAGLLLWPRRSFHGAAILLCVVIGAFIAQAFVLNGDVIHTIVIGSLVATLAWVQRLGSKMLSTRP